MKTTLYNLGNVIFFTMKCSQNECTCSNGKPDTENCDEHGSERCQNCEQFYHLNRADIKL